jgi:hypothetical protein
MTETLIHKPDGAPKKPKVEMPSQTWLKKALEHLPDSVVKKFKLREKLLGTSEPVVAEPNSIAAEQDEPDPDFEKIKAMTLADLDPERWFDPELNFYTLEEINALQHQAEYSIKGVNLTFSVMVQNGRKYMENQVVAVDVQGYRQGDISLGFSLVPDTMNEPLRSGKYELMLGNSALSVPDGQSSSFGYVRIEREEPKAARLEAERVLLVAHQAMTDFMLQHQPPHSQPELFASIKAAVQKTAGENFVMDTTWNVGGFE